MQEYSPQTITNELLGKLTPYDIENRLSQLESKRFLREAKKLQNSYPSEFFMLSGIIYSLECRYEETVKSFENALSNASEDYEPILLNYAVALRNLGKYDEAFKVLDTNYYDGSLELTKQILFSSLNVGLFKKARLYNEKLKILSPVGRSTDYSAYIEKILETCEKLKIELKDVFEVHQIVLKSIYKFKKEPITNNAITSDESDTLLLLFNVDADAKILSKIALNLADEFAIHEIPAVINNTVTPVVLKGSK